METINNIPIKYNGTTTVEVASSKQLQHSVFEITKGRKVFVLPPFGIYYRIPFSINYGLIFNKLHVCYHKNFPDPKIARCLKEIGVGRIAGSFNVSNFDMNIDNTIFSYMVPEQRIVLISNVAHSLDYILNSLSLVHWHNSDLSEIDLEL
jgi:hypothetical protein